ncbi:MAG TPA: FAD:protein FMN transferase, partial [Dongiaceae bacterium]|nr:FAD:protein FMN transferase [Dongiaceae bacterium]
MHRSKPRPHPLAGLAIALPVAATLTAIPIADPIARSAAALAANAAAPGPAIAAARPRASAQPKAELTPDDRPVRSVSWLSKAMGTYVQIIVVTPDSAATAPIVARAQAEFARLDSLMTNWTSTSEVARINSVAGHETTTVEPEVATVIAASIDTWKHTDGAYDITVEPLVRAWGFIGGHPHKPTDEEARAAAARVGGRYLHFDPVTRKIWFEHPDLKIDLGGIAKGYACERAAKVLSDAGVKDALVNVSGNMRALGHPPDAPAWRIGVRDPRDRMSYFARVTIADEGISTSAKYEQFVAADGRTYGHIMDPRTGKPAEGLIAVTLVGKDAFVCDAWDTPLFVLGGATARRKVKERTDLAAILVEPG